MRLLALLNREIPLPFAIFFLGAFALAGYWAGGFHG